MTSFDLTDYDMKALTALFYIVRDKLISHLENKVSQLKEYRVEDCCTISNRVLSDLKLLGGTEWKQLTSVSARIAARRKVDENLAMEQVRKSFEGGGGGDSGTLQGEASLNLKSKQRL